MIIQFEHQNSTYQANLSQPLDISIPLEVGDNTVNCFYAPFMSTYPVVAGDFVGSNRLKHMVDAFCHVERSKDGLERSLYFSKNRDCDKDFKVFFSIYDGSVSYAYEIE